MDGLGGQNGTTGRATSHSSRTASPVETAPAPALAASSARACRPKERSPFTATASSPARSRRPATKRVSSASASTIRLLPEQRVGGLLRSGADPRDRQDEPDEHLSLHHREGDGNDDRYRGERAHQRVSQHHGRRKPAARLRGHRLLAPRRLDGVERERPPRERLETGIDRDVRDRERQRRGGRAPPDGWFRRASHQPPIDRRERERRRLSVGAMSAPCGSLRSTSTRSKERAGSRSRRATCS